MTNFSRNLTMKFRNVRYGINLEKKIVTCIIDVEFNHPQLGLYHCLTPKEFRRLSSVCGNNYNVYTGSFTVTGKARCFKGDEDIPEDEFDERKGSRIAYHRAKKKALKRCRAILNQYNKVLSKISGDLVNSMDVLNTMIDAADNKVEEILG